MPREFGPWQTVWKRHRRLAGDGTWDKVLAVLLAEADAAGELGWQVSVDSTVSQAHQRGTNLTRAERGTAGHYRITGICWPSPLTTPSAAPVGGLATKVHQLVDTRGLPLVVLVGPGQGGDSPMLPALLELLRVARIRPGRPRTTLTALPGDTAFSSRGTRAMRRSRGITAVIAEPSDQVRHRKLREPKGGRPPAFDAHRYKDRNVVERSYNAIKQWCALATRYDKLAITY